MLHSHIHEYGQVQNGWNGHRMLVTYIHNVEHRNPEIRKTRNDFFVQVRNLFYYFWVKGFDIRRETQSFYAGLLHLTPISCGTPGAQIRLAPRRRLVSTLLTFFKFPKTFARFRCVMSPALCHPFHHLRLLWHLWVTRCYLHQGCT